MNTINETFQVPACNLNELQKEIARLNRRAKKLGLSAITMTTANEHVAEFLIPWTREEEREIAFVMAQGGASPKARYVKLKAFDVTIAGEAPKLDGWKLVAVLDHLPGGHAAIVRNVPGETVDTEALSKSEPICGHCKTKRIRKDTVVLRHDDGREIQVGKQCLKDFLGGHATPDTLAYAAQFLKRLREIASSFGAPRDFSGRYCIPVEKYLSFVAKEIRERGFVSKKLATEKNAGFDPAVCTRPVLPTSFLAQTAMCVVDGLIKDHKPVEPRLIPTDADCEIGKAALEWAKNLKGSSDFALNLRTLASAELPEVEYRHLGLLAAGVNSYLKEREIASTRVSYGQSKHVGEIGKRVEFVLTIRGKNVFDTQYGQTTLVRFGDESGNLFTWWASNAPEFALGETYLVRATVKKHDDYKGTKQTVLTRAVFVEKVEVKAPEFVEKATTG